MLRWLVCLAACSSPPAMMQVHRDGGLQFEQLDLSQTGAPDLRGGGGDLLAVDMMSSGTCATALASLSWNFEGGPTGFTHEAIDGYAGDNSWPFDEWERGTPSGSGPGACHTGTWCFGTYMTGNYASCERAMLTTPTIDLSACSSTNVKLVFWHWFSFWTDAGGPWFDGGLVEFSSDGGNSWSPSGATYPGTIAINPSQGLGYDCLSPNSFYVDGKGGYVQSSTGWQMVEIPIAAALRTSQFRVRFAYSSGVVYQTTDPDTSRSHAKPGWYVDDLSIVAQ